VCEDGLGGPASHDDGFDDLALGPVVLQLVIAFGVKLVVIRSSFLLFTPPLVMKK